MGLGDVYMKLNSNQVGIVMGLVVIVALIAFSQSNSKFDGSSTLSNVDTTSGAIVSGDITVDNTAGVVCEQWNCNTANADSGNAYMVCSCVE